ncbi:hypothetical protein J4E90_004829 [Alternaria incomplexa]|uniref:uncharacterized protein n=1 Tax=Alternaria incomplexa TaxID=1187928 RepID=UPI00221FAEBE|nr:uncharacterized protein J4E90_004829 [Alternaria incomplexa]KAI4914795.1 hypothetical protein J4E90_004829 [Alternaria incomplexa]
MEGDLRIIRFTDSEKELLYSNAQQAISEFPVGEAKERMYNALSTFRMPYWDAAAVPPKDTSSFPAIVQQETVEIEVPSGDSTTTIHVSNPLYAYHFHPLPVDDFKSVPWILWNSTKRYPASMAVSAKSQNDLVAESLDSNRVNLMQQTYQMLGMQANYLDVSNSMVEMSTEGAIPNSLESVHDTLHNAIGRGGHMYDAAYSAFDPIFWLLHTNVDRLLAIWQDLHPDSFVESHVNPWPTFATAPYSEADENTPGDFWTSASVRDHTVFGSTYPEFLGLSATDTLVGRVNALYGGNATSRFSWETARAEQHVAVPQNSDVQYQYSAVIRAQHMGPGCVSKVRVFLDADMNINAGPANTQKWMSEPGFVGYAGFQNAVGQEKTEMQTNGVVALTAALKDRMRMGKLRSMDENVAGTYLQEKLHWLLVDVRLFDPANSHACRYLLTNSCQANDNVIAPEHASGFSIGVSWARIAPGTASTLPAVLGGGFEQLPHATMGKAGGVQ